MNSRIPPGGKQIKATATAFDVVECILELNGAGLSELADHLDFAKSTIHCHLNTLEDKGYVTYDGAEYHVGLKFLTLGGHAGMSNPLYRVAKPEVDKLAEETGIAAQIAVEEHGKGIYIHQSRGEQAVQTDSRIGTERYLHSTAFGKAILAHYPEERVNEILDRHGLPAETRHTTTSREELFGILEEISERGVAFDDNEQIDGVRCVAAPIHSDGEVVGAISVSGPNRHMTDEQFRETTPELVRDTVRVIEITMSNL